MATTPHPTVDCNNVLCMHTELNWHKDSVKGCDLTLFPVLFHSPSRDGGQAGGEAIVTASMVNIDHINFASVMKQHTTIPHSHEVMSNRLEGMFCLATWGVASLVTRGVVSMVTRGVVSLVARGVVSLATSLMGVVSVATGGVVLLATRGVFSLGCG